MAQYTASHTGKQLDNAVTEVLEKAKDWTAKQDALKVNPTTTTATLNGLTIGDTSYSIGGGKIDDVKVDGTSIVTDKVASLVCNTTYNATSNKIATMKDIENAITTVINADY